MTKESTFKRAVRARARKTGETYTQARAAMENDALRARILRPVQHDALKAHLETRYSTQITSLTAFDGDHPATLHVERADGPPWVARVFSSTEDTIERVEADAAILRWLETAGYPAERLAHAEPVSAFEGGGVMVTNLVPGQRPDATADVQGRLGELLGRLHSLAPAAGAPSRDGGSFDHDPAHYGRPAQDIAAARNFLNTVEHGVDPSRRDKFEWLREQVLAADDCEGLPEAFTHANFGPFNAVAAPDGELTIVGWAASGRAPRLAALGWLLYCTGGNPEQVDAIARGYSQHVQPTGEELDRLAGAIVLRDLYLGSWYYWSSVSTGYTPSGGEGWWPSPGYQAGVAERATEAFAAAAK